MIFHRLGLINKNQRGFTLIEILVALAITGLITGGITGTIFQVINGSARSSNHMTAVRQVQNAGYWLSHDGKMAQIVELAEGPLEENPVGTKFPLKLTWTDWDGTEHQVIYTLEVGGEPKQLQRQYLTCAAGGSPMGDETTIVAQFIDVSIDPDTGKPRTNCDFTGGKLVFTVTAAVGGDWQQASETRVYQVKPRPSS